MRRMETATAMAIACLVGMAVPAAAQMMPKPNERPPVTDDAAKGKATAEPLSDKLSRTDGVIKPPAGVDPQMQKPARQPDSSMPVIPPPGSPGGDPTVKPK